MTQRPTPDEETVEEATPAADQGGDGPTANDYTVAFSPRNVAVGLAIVAGLVGLIVRRRRRTKDG